MKFLHELKQLKEGEVNNVVFKLEIPADAEDLLALKKNDQMAAIEGEEEGDGSFIQNQDIITVEYITRKDDKIYVYPVLDSLKSKDVSSIGARLQRAFNTWCLEYTSDEGLDEAVTNQERGPNESEIEAMEAGVVFGEIGEELLKIQSQLDRKLESQLGKLEAKHEIYLGEDLRELKQYIKLAIKSTTKLYDALVDIPAVE
jgi:hypothetical protein